MNSNFRFVSTVLLTLALILGSQRRLAAQPAEAVPGADQADEAQALIDSLIDDLTGADEAARQKAQKQLIGMGDAAIAPLQKYLRGTHLPVSKQRVQGVLDELETHFKFTPTLVTIKMDNVPTRDVFKEFSKQGGIAIEAQWDFWNQNYGGGNNSPLKKTSIDIKDQPFWPALFEFAKKVHVNVNLNGGNQRQVYLYPGGGGSQFDGPKFTSGPITFSLQGIYREINFSPNPTKSMRMQIQALLDPKVNVLDGSYYIKVTKADGDKGTSVMPANQQDNNATSGYNGMQLYMQAPLNYESGTNTKIAEFKGSARLRIRSGVAKLEIPDIKNSAGKTFTAGPWTVTVNSFKEIGDKNNPQWELKFTAETKEGPPPGEPWSYPGQGSMSLLDTNGETFNHYGNSMNGGPQRLEETLTFGKQRVSRSRRASASQPSSASPEPDKFIWEITTGTRNIRVPVEFTDIPIPGQEAK